MNFLVLFPAFLSFFITLLILPSWIKKAEHFGFVGRDMNKIDGRKVSEGGGISVITGVIFGILFYVAIKQFYLKSNSNLIEIFALVISLLMLAVIGLIDGSLGWRVGLRRRYSIMLCLCAAVPLMVINAGQSSILLPLIGKVNAGIIYPLIFIPLAIVGTSTTFNFLAGFNGLEAGQGIIIISALSLVAYFTGSNWLALIGLIAIASLFAFLFYNFYPSKVFPGDVLTYPVGGLIGIMAILGNFERIALFFYIPYIIEFFLKTRGKLVKQSFGLPKKDGSLALKYPKIYGLEHLAIYLMQKSGIKTTEKSVVYSIWAFQLLIIIAGFIIFGKYLIAR